MKYYVHCGIIKEILDAENPEDAMVKALEKAIEGGSAEFEKAIEEGSAGFAMLVAASEKGFFEDLLDEGDIDDDVKMVPTYLLLKAMGHEDLAEGLKEFFNSDKSDSFVKSMQDDIYKYFEEDSWENSSTSDVLA